MTETTSKRKFDPKGMISRGKIAAPLRGLAYGQEGIGKTGLLAQVPNILVVGAEEGSAHYNVARIAPDCWRPFKDPTTGQLRGENSLMDLLDWFATPDAAEFTAIGLDTLDAAEKMCIEYICARDHGSSDPVKKYTRDTWIDGKPYLDGYGYGSGTKVVETEFLELLSKLDRARRARNVHVLMTAHQEISKEKNQSGDDFGVYAPRLTKLARDQVIAWCDFVLFCEFDRKELQGAEHDKRGRQIGKAKAVSDGIRIAHTERFAAHIAKNRLGLPRTIELDWQQIVACAQSTYGDAGAQILQLRAEIEQLLLQVPEETRAKAADAVEKNKTSVLRLVEIKGKLQARAAEAAAASPSNGAAVAAS